MSNFRAFARIWTEENRRAIFKPVLFVFLLADLLDLLLCGKKNTDKKRRADRIFTGLLCMGMPVVDNDPAAG